MAAALPNPKAAPKPKVGEGQTLIAALKLKGGVFDDAHLDSGDALRAATAVMRTGRGKALNIAVGNWLKQHGNADNYEKGFEVMVEARKGTKRKLNRDLEINKKDVVKFAKGELASLDVVRPAPGYDRIPAHESQELMQILGKERLEPADFERIKVVLAGMHGVGPEKAPHSATYACCRHCKFNEAECMRITGVARPDERDGVVKAVNTDLEKIIVSVFQTQLSDLDKRTKVLERKVSDPNATYARTLVIEIPLQDAGELDEVLEETEKKLLNQGGRGVISKDTSNATATTTRLVFVFCNNHWAQRALHIVSPWKFAESAVAVWLEPTVAEKQEQEIG